ncbi:MAG: hypothetical protein MK205_00655 [Candidatus Poseidoniia archaeon]|nr:hypothetical protein [Candidatus Poseidoniia archaeon]
MKLLQTIKVIKEENLRIKVKEENLRIKVKEENLRIRVEKRSNKAVGHNVVRHYPLLSNGVGQQKKEYPNGLQKLNLEKWLFQERLPL